MLLIRVAGDELDLLQEGLRVDPTSVVGTEDLREDRREIQNAVKANRDSGVRGRRGDGTHSDGVHGDVVSLAVGDDLRQLQVVM